MDWFIERFTRQYKEDGYLIQKKAEYTLLAFSLIAFYVLTGVILMQFGRQTGYMYATSIFVVILILVITWIVFIKRKLLLSQYILLSAGILAICSHIFMRLNFHFYIQIIFVLFVGYIVHINKTQILIILSSLIFLMIARTILLFYQYSANDSSLMVFKQNIFLVGSIIMLMLFVHYFNTIIAKDIVETQQLKEIANIDVLTGLYCRKKFNSDIKRLNEENILYCLAVLDIDHFKSVNDQFGHEEGDKVLIKLANHMRNSFNPDNLYRWGGEEFVIITFDQKIEVFINELESLRLNVMNSQLIPNDNVTISIGVSHKNSKENTSDIFIQADNALYIAKNSGRNKTVKAEVTR